jgi:hypothetical protein
MLVALLALVLSAIDRHIRPDDFRWTDDGEWNSTNRSTGSTWTAGFREGPRRTVAGANGFAWWVTASESWFASTELTVIVPVGFLSDLFCSPPPVFARRHRTRVLATGPQP